MTLHRGGDPALAELPRDAGLSRVARAFEEAEGEIAQPGDGLAFGREQVEIGNDPGFAARGNLKMYPKRATRRAIQGHFATTGWQIGARTRQKGQRVEAAVQKRRMHMITGKLTGDFRPGDDLPQRLVPSQPDTAKVRKARAVLQALAREVFIKCGRLLGKPRAYGVRISSRRRCGDGFIGQ